MKDKTPQCVSMQVSLPYPICLPIVTAHDLRVGAVTRALLEGCSQQTGHVLCKPSNVFQFLAMCVPAIHPPKHCRLLTKDTVTPCEPSAKTEIALREQHSGSPNGVGSLGWSWKMGDCTCQSSITITFQVNAYRFCAQDTQSCARSVR